MVWLVYVNVSLPGPEKPVNAGLDAYAMLLTPFVKETRAYVKRDSFKKALAVQVCNE